MKKCFLTPVLFVVALLCTELVAAQNTNSVKDPWLYIQTYYMTFTSGYYQGEEYIAMTKNYQVSLKDSIFLMEYDRYDRDRVKVRQTLHINLKHVTELESNGTNIIEVKEISKHTFVVSENLKFTTPKETFNIEIYYEADIPVEQSDIFKAFQQLITKQKGQ